MSAILWRLRREDTGTSLLEIVVGMAIMTVFMGMFTGAVIMMTSSANKVDATVNTAGQLNNAYLRLDKLIRYASAISTPATAGAGNDWYVEFAVPRTQNTTTCYQLRVNTGAQKLQQRTWAVDADQNASAASVWLPLASSVTNGTAAAGTPGAPFVITTTPSSLFEQLQVTLRAAATSPAAAKAASSVTFTALNSTQNTSPSICQQRGRP